MEQTKSLGITIAMDENGQILVSGPMIKEGTNVFDLPICLFLLDQAKDIIKLHNKKVGASHIIKPSNGGRISF